MDALSMLYVAGLVLGGGLVGVVGVVAVRNRRTPGAVPLAVLSAAVAVWVFAVLVMVLSPSFATSLLAERVMYVGIVAVAPTFLAFALDYTGRGDLLTRRTVALLAVEPVLALAVIATNGRHGLFWTGVEPGATFSGLVTTHGPLFWVHAVYSYLLLLVASALLARFVAGSTHVYRQQAAALTVAVAVPWAANALYLLDAVAADPTPLGFAASGAALAWAVVRADFVQLAPVARETVVETLGSAVFVIDRDGRLADVNPAGRELLPQDDVVGLDLESLMAANDASPDRLAELDGGLVEFTVNDEDGPRHFEVEASRLHDARDRFLGRLVVARDVTTRREREAALREKNERLDQFASVVSHDLRNPLSVNRSYVQLAMDSGEDEHLEKALAAAERMETIVEDVLALAREGDDVSPDGEYDVGALARAAWGVVDTDGATLGLADPPTVRADRARLLRALENLFRNAVEHAIDDDGTVTVTVGALDGGSGFYVADDGPGIPADRRETVLAPGESSGGGTGLGLAIVDTIVDGHGWTLSVAESEAGGALFEVRGAGEK